VAKATVNPVVIPDNALPVRLAEKNDAIAHARNIGP
jgi:hypothetical protein